MNNLSREILSEQVRRSSQKDLQEQGFLPEPINNLLTNVRIRAARIETELNKLGFSKNAEEFQETFGKDRYNLTPDTMLKRYENLMSRKEEEKAKLVSYQEELETLIKQLREKRDSVTSQPSVYNRVQEHLDNATSVLGKVNEELSKVQNQEQTLLSLKKQIPTASSSWSESLSTGLKNFLSNKTAMTILGVTIFGLIAYYFWKRYNRDKCEGLTGSALKACKARAIDQAINGIKATIPKCKSQPDPKKCIQDAKKIIAEWEAKKRTL